MRILLIGFENKPKEEKDEEIQLVKVISKRMKKIEYYDFKYPLPTLYEYQMIIIAPIVFKGKKITFSNFGVLHKPLWEEFLMKKDEIERFFNSDSFNIMILPLHYNLEEDSWLPFKSKWFKLVTKQGLSIKINSNHWLGHFMEKYSRKNCFRWTCHLEKTKSMLKDIEENIIATNDAGYPISFEIDCGRNGKIVFLPNFSWENSEEEVKFLRDLINAIKQKFFNISELVEPEWINKEQYMFEEEKKLKKKLQEINRHLDEFKKVKSILWAYDIELTNNVAFTLEKLGIKVKNLEKFGKEDLEIDEQELHAIVEVKGLKSIAKIKHLDQLNRWYAVKFEEDENIKGVLIVNEFRDLEPEEKIRKCREKLKTDFPFDKNLIKYAKKLDFCLMSTRQLFEAYKKKLKGKFNKQLFLKKIKETRGILKYP